MANYVANFIGNILADYSGYDTIDVPNSSDEGLIKNLPPLT
jgi:hypothetical protein